MKHLYRPMTALGWPVLLGLIGVTIWLGLRMAGPFAEKDFSSWAFGNWQLLAGPVHQALKDRVLPVNGLWPFISHGFVHFGWDHLAFNMIPLAVLGWLTLRRSGVTLFLVSYFGGMILAALGYLAVVSSTTGVGGASGAVHALGGAWVVWAWADRAGRRWRALPSVLWLAFIIGVNGYLYISMQGAFAWELHITGVLAGMAMAPLIVARPVQASIAPKSITG